VNMEKKRLIDMQRSTSVSRYRPSPAGRKRRKALPPLPRPETVPSELTGRFVAWTPDGLQILASGDTPIEARERAGGRLDLVIEWIPPLNQLRSVPQATPPSS